MRQIHFISSNSALALLTFSVIGLLFLHLTGVAQQQHEPSSALTLLPPLIGVWALDRDKTWGSFLLLGWAAAGILLLVAPVPVHWFAWIAVAAAMVSFLLELPVLWRFDARATVQTVLTVLITGFIFGDLARPYLVWKTHHSDYGWSRSGLGDEATATLVANKVRFDVKGELVSLENGWTVQVEVTASSDDGQTHPLRAETLAFANREARSNLSSCASFRSTSHYNHILRPGESFQWRRSFPPHPRRPLNRGRATELTVMVSDHPPRYEPFAVAVIRVAVPWLGRPRIAIRAGGHSVHDRLSLQLAFDRQRDPKGGADARLAINSQLAPMVFDDPLRRR